MKILKLSLSNFRQFYQEQSIEFGDDPDKNITIIHGENGAGKTTLLNAFKWCFYGTTDFDTGVDNILNEYALASANNGQVITLFVEINFEHEGSLFTARRSIDYKKLTGGEYKKIGGAVFTLNWIDSAGSLQKANNPESYMNQIFPEKLHSYFFFNGERIEKLAYTSSAHEIQKAVKNIMGLEIIERAKKHLKEDVRKAFTQQMKQGASKELQDAIDEKIKLEEVIQDLSEKITGFNNNIYEYENELVLVQKSLKEIEEVSEHQKKREAYEAEIIEIDDNLRLSSEKINKIISSYGMLAFINKASDKVKSILDDRRAKGELPYAIKKCFINDLIEREKCICGTVLSAGSTPRHEIEKFKSSAGENDLEDAFLRTSAALVNLPDDRKKLFDDIDFELSIRKKLIDKKDKLNGLLDDISTKFSDPQMVNAFKLEEKRKELLKGIQQFISDRGFAIGTKNNKEIEKNKLDSQIEELDKKSQISNLAKKRRILAEECAKVLEDLHLSLSDLTRTQLSSLVNKTFQNIIRKNYHAEIESDYSLTIKKDIPGIGMQVVHEKSTGESQVTSLSFIASLVSMAKKQYKKDSKFFKGGIFPIIMDSPFGALDPEYRSLVARYIPELADQVIIMVSHSQWSGDVERECSSRIGKHVSLIYNAPVVREVSSSYYAKSGAKFEHTIIEDGYHG